MASQPGYFSVQEFSDAGALLVGGRLYTYAYGTTTQKTAYTDVSGLVPHTYTSDGAGGQYIALNSRGELPAPLYLTSGAYDLALKRTDGSTVWTRRAEIAFTASDVASSITTAVGSDGTLSFRNRLHNGNFAINQRAFVSGASLGAGAYGHDRWKAGAGGCTYTVAGNGVDNTITITAGSLMQVIEGVNVEGGVYALQNAGTSLARIAVNGAATAGAYAAAISTSPLLSATATASQTITVEFTTGTVNKAQLEPGTTSTSFERRPYGLELVLCQRYLPAFNSVGGSDDVALGGTLNTTSGLISFQFLAEPRVPPTGITVSSVGHFSLTSMIASTVVTALTFSSASKRICRMTATGTGTPYVASQPAILFANSSSGQILFTGCEL